VHVGVEGPPPSSVRGRGVHFDMPFEVPEDPARPGARGVASPHAVFRPDSRWELLARGAWELAAAGLSGSARRGDRWVSRSATPVSGSSGRVRRCRIVGRSRKCFANRARHRAGWAWDSVLNTSGSAIVARGSVANSARNQHALDRRREVRGHLVLQCL